MDDGIPGQQLNDEIKELCKGLFPTLKQRYPVIRDAYLIGYDFPDLDPVRHEICIALALGLNQAAITLTNHMLESLMKTLLIYHHSLKNQGSSPGMGAPTAEELVDFLADGRRLYGQNSLENNLNAACSQGIITKEQKETLKKLRNRFRDAYSHGDKEKTFGDTTVDVQPVRIEGGQFVDGPKASPRAAEFLIAQGLLQALHAEQLAVHYFLYIDALARECLERVFPNSATADGFVVEAEGVTHDEDQP